jgi:tyrosyl-tRNA synthetase
MMLLKHFQLAGHKPYALIGGAKGMIGDRDYQKFKLFGGYATCINAQFSF